MEGERKGRERDAGLEDGGGGRMSRNSSASRSFKETFSP